MKPIIVGHRGVAGRCPENTQASIQTAISDGLKWVEVDVQPTKDGELVICHDHTIDRCSNGTGRVDSYTLAQLKLLDFGAWFGEHFKGEPIMTLDELLSISKQHDLRLNLEIKLDTDSAEEVAVKLAKSLDKFQLDYEMVVLSSFSPSVMRTLYRVCPEYNLGVISDRLTPSVTELLREISAYSCHLNYQYIQPSDIEQLKALNHKIWCFTINEPDSFPQLNKVDAIFTDYPEKFLRSLT